MKRAWGEEKDGSKTSLSITFYVVLVVFNNVFCILKKCRRYVKCKHPNLTPTVKKPVFHIGRIYTEKIIILSEC